MTKKIRQNAIADILEERKYQLQQKEWNDNNNTQGLWASYIVNYVSRWAMPYSFNVDKYTFRICMIKTAALALAAIEWYDVQTECFDEKQALKVGSKSTLKEIQKEK